MEKMKLKEEWIIWLGYLEFIYEAVISQLTMSLHKRDAPCYMRILLLSRRIELLGRTSLGIHRPKRSIPNCSRLLVRRWTAMNQGNHRELCWVAKQQTRYGTIASLRKSVLRILTPGSSIWSSRQLKYRNKLIIKFVFKFFNRSYRFRVGSQSTLTPNPSRI